jgi:hypothetical protein
MEPLRVFRSAAREIEARLLRRKSEVRLSPLILLLRFATALALGFTALTRRASLMVDKVEFLEALVLEELPGMLEDLLAAAEFLAVFLAVVSSSSNSIPRVIIQPAVVFLLANLPAASMFAEVRSFPTVCSRRHSAKRLETAGESGWKRLVEYMKNEY